MRVGDRQRIQEAAGGDVHQVDVRSGGVEELHPLVEADPALGSLVAADAHLQAERRSGLLAACCQDLEREPHPVLGSAAVFVGAMVEERSEERGEQVHVPGVDHGHVEAGYLQAADAVDPVLLDLIHLVPVDLLGGGRVVDAGYDRGCERRAVGIAEVADGSGVGEFDGQLRPVAVDLIGKEGQAPGVGVAGDRQASVEVARAVEVDGGGADGHQAGPRAGLRADEGQQVVGEGAREGFGVIRHHGRVLYAVLERHLADGDRPEHVRVVGCGWRCGRR